MFTAGPTLIPADAIEGKRLTPAVGTYLRAGGTVNLSWIMRQAHATARYTFARDGARFDAPYSYFFRVALRSLMQMVGPAMNVWRSAKEAAARAARLDTLRDTLRASLADLEWQSAGPVLQAAE
jgi:hypothetical protein